MKLKGRDAPKLDPVVVQKAVDGAAEYAMRTPLGPSELDKFTAELEDHERPFARMLFRMECQHEKTNLVQSSSMGTPEMISCLRCGYMWKRIGGTRKVLLAEWNGYLPNGYDAFDWEELFTADKSMWRFIFDEVQDEMLAPFREEGGRDEVD